MACNQCFDYCTNNWCECYDGGCITIGGDNLGSCASCASTGQSCFDCSCYGYDVYPDSVPPYLDDCYYVDATYAGPCCSSGPGSGPGSGTGRIDKSQRGRRPGSPVRRKGGRVNSNTNFGGRTQNNPKGNPKK